MKKKWICIVIALLLLAGCGQQAETDKTTGPLSSEETAAPKTAPSSETDRRGIPVSREAAEYLNALGCGQSQILSCSFDQVAQCVQPAEKVSMSRTAKSMRDLMDSHYHFSQKSFDEGIENNDLVTLRFSGSGGDDFQEAFVIMASEAGTVFPDLQKKLIGMKQYGSDKWNVPKGGLAEQFGIEEKTLQFEITSVDSLSISPDRIESETAKGFYPPIRLYEAGLNDRVGSLSRENMVRARMRFLNACTACCEYQLADEDIRAYAERAEQSLTEKAAGLGMTAEEFWGHYSSGIIGPTEQIDSDFHAACRKTAEEMIKMILFAGAYASEYGLTVSDGDVESAYGIQKSRTDAQNWISLTYQRLEDLVIADSAPDLSAGSAVPGRADSSAVFEWPEDYVFYHVISAEKAEMLSEIERKLSDCHKAAENGTASEQEKQLDSFKPTVRFDAVTGEITVTVIAEEADLEKAAGLFRTVVGEYDVVFRAIVEDEGAVFVKREFFTFFQNFA